MDTFDRARIVTKLQRLQTLRGGRIMFGVKGPPLPPGGFFHPDNRFNFVLSGIRPVRLPVGGRTVALHQSPGDGHVSAHDSWECPAFDRAYDLLCIVPRGDYLRVASHEYVVDARGAIGMSGTYFHTSRPYAEALRLTAEALLACARHPRADGVRGLVDALLALCIAEIETSDEPENQGIAEALYGQVRKWIDGHFQNPDLSRDWIAKVFDIHPTYVSRLFRRHGTHSFMDYLTGLRIDFARKLLTETELKIHQIAAQCGFRETAYFVKRFRETQGMPPAAYRAALLYLPD